MTGRRLYDLLCDEWAGRQEWQRQSSYNKLGLPAAPVAWPFLGAAEKMAFNGVARRLKGVKRS